MLEVLRILGLSQELLETAEKYLLEGEKELLGAFPKQDLSKIKEEEKKAFAQLFSSLIKRNHLTEAVRLFQIAYQIGGPTSANVFPIQDFWYRTEESEFMKTIDAYQAVSIYAEGFAYEKYRLHRETVQTILKLAGNSKDVIEQALDNWRSEYNNGKLLAFSAYFSLLREGASKNDEPVKTDGKNGILSGIAGILKKKAENYPETSKEGQYIKEFEQSLLLSVDSLLPVNEQENKKIQEYIKADKEGDKSLKEEAAQLFRTYAMNEYLLKLIAGCINIHYDLSPGLKSLLKLCAYGNMEGTLDAIHNLMKKNGVKYFNGQLKADLMLEAVPYIIWCGKNDLKVALNYEIEHDFAAYEQAVSQVSLETNAVMMETLKKKSQEQYERLAANGVLELRRKLTEDILPAGNAKAAVQDFLLYDGPVEALYPFVKEFENNRGYYYSHASAKMDNYRRTHGKDEFYKRCLTYLSFTESGYFFENNFVKENDGYRSKEIEELFKDWTDMGLAVVYQLSTAGVIYDSFYSEKRKASFLGHVNNIFTDYLERNEEEVLRAFEMSNSTGRFIGIGTLSLHPDRYKVSLLNAFSDTSKQVTERLVTTLSQLEKWEPEVLNKLKSKKSGERETALFILSKWNKDYKSVIEEALETEKSKKLQDLMRKLLCIDESADTDRNLTVEDYVKELHKGGRKRGILWAYETPFTAVHSENGTEMAEEYMQAILLSYYNMNIPGVNKEVLSLTEPLNKKELALYMNELFDKWMDAGAEAKKKWVLYAAAIHGGADIVQKLHSNINQWPQNARGAIAAEAVKALALNDTPSALLIVDSISRKFKFKQIKTAAAEALSFAAEQLGLTTEELADKIVPDLGFNEEMQRIFDYGERRFFVYITPSLEIEIQDESEKKIKNLPAPGKKDDEAKAQSAFEEFKLLKKQIKTVVANQKLRLDLALSVERKWDKAAWESLFVKNPIMHQFAIGLIWGTYEEDKLTNTFRYMEDGSFNTEDEEEFQLPEAAKIGLVHPIEFTPDSTLKWKEQLKDYEVEQPIVQLERKVFPITDEEKGKKCLERFGGLILNPMSLSGKLLGMGWYRGSVQDAGGYYTFYREDPSLLLGVELNFSGSFVGYEEEDVTVYDARFYEAGSIKRGSYVYDEVTEETAITLDKVPARYFSEIIYQLEKATASSQEKDENWKNKH
jgi:hypothetical protein